MTGSFILDYYLLVFLASCGAFQVIAVHHRLWGMMFFKRRPISLLLGLALLIASFTWFFLSEPRNVPDTALGMNGNEQFAYFFAGLGTGLTFTFLLTSLLNWRLGAGQTDFHRGLDALRSSNYIRILYNSYCRWRAQVRSSGSTSVPVVEGQKENSVPE